MAEQVDELQESAVARGVVPGVVAVEASGKKPGSPAVIRDEPT